MALGPFAGPIYTIILIVDCIFFLFLEWWLPREDLDFVHEHWDPKVFTEVGVPFSRSNFTNNLTCFA
jgi:phosphatidylinositol glycan class A protein